MLSTILNKYMSIIGKEKIYYVKQSTEEGSVLCAHSCLYSKATQKFRHPTVLVCPFQQGGSPSDDQVSKRIFFSVFCRDTSSIFDAKNTVCITLKLAAADNHQIDFLSCKCLFNHLQCSRRPARKCFIES